MAESHLAEFARHLIAKHGAQTTGMIFVAFTQVGNVLPGAGNEEQKAAINSALADDERLAFSDEAGTWSIKPEQAA